MKCVMPPITIAKIRSSKMYQLAKKARIDGIVIIAASAVPRIMISLVDNLLGGRGGRVGGIEYSVGGGGEEEGLSALSISFVLSS